MGARAGSERTRIEGLVLGGTPIRAPFSGRSGVACLVQIGVPDYVTTNRGLTRERLDVRDAALVFEKLRVQLEDGVLEITGAIELSTPGADGPGEPIDERATIDVAEQWLRDRAAAEGAATLAKRLEDRSLRYRELLLGQGDPVELVGVFSPIDRALASYRHATEVPDHADWRARPDLGPVEVIDLTLVRSILPMGAPGS